LTDCDGLIDRLQHGHRDKRLAKLDPVATTNNTARVIWAIMAQSTLPRRQVGVHSIDGFQVGGSSRWRVFE
jgi:hypothetical protein